MKSARKRLTYANVMSSIAVFLVVAGGSAFAATQLAKNSVGTKQLKKNAVTLAKINSAAKSALKGATGPQGLQGAPGAPGPKGERGEPGPLLEALPSGKTLKGGYTYAGHYVTGYRPTDLIGYPVPVAFTPTPHIIGIGGAPTAQCPGTAEEPKAAAGFLCVYETRNDSSTTLSANNEFAKGHLGAVLFAAVPANTDFEFNGTWAVTAP